MRSLLGLAFVLGIGAATSSCIFVTDDVCDEGVTDCNGDFIEECIDDEWQVIEDCLGLCGGTCAIEEPSGDAVCLC